MKCFLSLLAHSTQGNKCDPNRVRTANSHVATKGAMHNENLTLGSNLIPILDAAQCH